MSSQWLQIILALALLALIFMGSRMVIFGSMLELLHLRRKKIIKLWTNEIKGVQTK